MEQSHCRQMDASCPVTTNFHFCFCVVWMVVLSWVQVWDSGFQVWDVPPVLFWSSGCSVVCVPDPRAGVTVSMLCSPQRLTVSYVWVYNQRFGPWAISLPSRMCLLLLSCFLVFLCSYILSSLLPCSCSCCCKRCGVLLSIVEAFDLCVLPWGQGNECVSSSDNCGSRRFTDDHCHSHFYLPSISIVISIFNYLIEPKALCHNPRSKQVLIKVMHMEKTSRWSWAVFWP